CASDGYYGFAYW
nr:immunoglobulin heavy chain junction region [Mus musculus]MBK4184661.1 immunoglobulin heavy chain junction region [Mus musculus]MBK4184662.1 immunoglobulin heavy chain junction region [Mus musculus]